jgi:hypothetical protein
MHETVPSPKEYRSHPRGSPQVSRRRGAELGGRRFEGNLPAKTAASDRHCVGWPRAMLEGNLQGPQGYPIPIPRPPSTGCLRTGRLQAGIPGLTPHGQHATSPLPGDKGAEPRRSHLACLKPRETCACKPSCRTCSGIHPSTNATVGAWRAPELVRGDGGVAPVALRNSHRHCDPGEAGESNPVPHVPKPATAGLDRHAATRLATTTAGGPALFGQPTTGLWIKAQSNGRSPI